MHKKVTMEQYNSNTEYDMSKYIAALDIGTTKVVAIIGEVITENGQKKINVLSYGIAPTQGMKRGMINDLGQVIDAIKEATNKARFKEDFDIKQVYIGVAGPTVKSQIIKHYKNIPSGTITEKDIVDLQREVYRTATQDTEIVLHVIPHNYIIDKQYEHKNPVNINARQLDGEFHVISADKNFVYSIRQAVKHAGFDTKGIIFEPLASAEAVLLPEEKEAGVALVDIGGGTTDILIMHDNKIIHSSVIPFGADTITEDIRTALQVLKNVAEEMKIKYGTAVALKHLDNKTIEIPAISGRTSRSVKARSIAIIIQSRMVEIIDTLYKNLQQYVQSGQLAAGLTITGGGSLLKDLVPLIKYRTGLDIRLAAPNLTNIEELNKPQFATTQGLILLGDKMNKKSQTHTIQKSKKERQSKILGKIKGFFDDLFNIEPEDDE